jgi:hypothetical protein
MIYLLAEIHMAVSSAYRTSATTAPQLGANHAPLGQRSRQEHSPREQARRARIGTLSRNGVGGNLLHIDVKRPTRGYGFPGGPEVQLGEVWT